MTAPETHLARAAGADGSTHPEPHLEVHDLELAYGSFVLMRDLTFEVLRGEVFVVMGGSGCGKSTLLRHLLGLKETTRGRIHFDGRNLLAVTAEEREALTRRFGVLFQGGALWSTLTVAENAALPLEEHTGLSPSEIRDLVRLRLAWVGLQGFEEYYPAQLSGGMIKRAALARALALDPEILFIDEPSAGLDPVTSHRLDELILQLRDNLGTTIVVVTHELPSIFAIADRALFLDVAARTMTALGHPRTLLQSHPSEALRQFLTRGGGEPASIPGANEPRPAAAGQPQAPASSPTPYHP